MAKRIAIMGAGAMGGNTHELCHSRANETTGSRGNRAQPGKLRTAADSFVNGVIFPVDGGTIIRY